MEVVPWEEPVEDTSDCPTVIYDPDGTVVCRLNYTGGALADELLHEIENGLRDLWLDEHGR